MEKLFYPHFHKLFIGDLEVQAHLTYVKIYTQFALLWIHGLIYCGVQKVRNCVCVSHVEIGLVTSSCSLLEDRVTRLHGQLQRTQQHLMASSDPGSVDRKVLDDLYEDIHWLILVSGRKQDMNCLFVSFVVKKGHFGVLGFGTQEEFGLSA